MELTTTPTRKLAGFVGYDTPGNAPESLSERTDVARRVSMSASKPLRRLGLLGESFPGWPRVSVPGWVLRGFRRLHDASVRHGDDATSVCTRPGATARGRPHGKTRDWARWAWYRAVRLVCSLSTVRPPWVLVAEDGAAMTRAKETEMQQSKDQLRAPGAVLVPCSHPECAADPARDVGPWMFWVDCLLDPRLPDGPFLCDSHGGPVSTEKAQ